MSTYKERWQTWKLFKAMESSGFNIEDTHVRELELIERLVAMVCITLVWVYLIGDYKDINVKKLEY